jgi:hypothetical protein
MPRSQSKRKSRKIKRKSGTSKKQSIHPYRRSPARQSFNPLASPYGLHGFPGLGFPGLPSPFLASSGATINDINTSGNIAKYFTYKNFPNICKDRAPNEQDCNSNKNCQFNYKNNTCQVSQLKLEGLEKFSDQDTLEYLQTQPYASENIDNYKRYLKYTTDPLICSGRGNGIYCEEDPNCNVQGNECELRSGIKSGKTAIQNYDKSLSTPKVIQQNLQNKQNLLTLKQKQIQDQIDRSSSSSSSSYAPYKGELFY